MKFVNNAILICRIHGLYKQMMRADYERAKFAIIEMVTLLRTIKDIHLSQDTYKRVIDDFLHMRVDICLHKYDDVHNRMRNLYYYLMTPL
jgi:hypothetical protein